MNKLQKLYKIIGTGFTKDQYYESMNMALKRLDNEYTMLHYPLYVKDSDSFIQAQKNLTDFCISLLKPLKDKEILEIGCGNGVQALYINASYGPSRITGIDLDEANIAIANSERDRAKLDNVFFLADDAQKLAHVPSDSADVLLCIESAFHYPRKEAFLKEIHRVLKPGSYIVGIEPNVLNPLMGVYHTRRDHERNALFVNRFSLAHALEQKFSRVYVESNNLAVSYNNANYRKIINVINPLFTKAPFFKLFSLRYLFFAKK